MQFSRYPRPPTLPGLAGITYAFPGGGGDIVPGEIRNLLFVIFSSGCGTVCAIKECFCKASEGDM